MRNFLFLLIPFFTRAQLMMEPRVDLGTINAAYEIKGDVVIKNNGIKKAHLLRADAGRDVKVYTSKKTLLPSDTCLLTISFIPQKNGAFEEKIALVCNDRDQPYQILLSGQLVNVKRDDKLACYYFGSRRNSPVPVKETPLIVETPPQKRPINNKIPDNSSSPPPPPPASTPVPAPPHTPAPTLTPTASSPSDNFSKDVYKPNNIIFLVDISGSMRDSLKLPVMKEALLYLVKQIRDVDRLSFITYADTIKVLSEAASASERTQLTETIRSLKAGGMTKGKKAIFISQQLAQKHFIEGGNNEIIIATDGKFRFEREDEKMFKERQGKKPVTLSTVAFGNDKEALNNLRSISRKGNGSFIHLRSKQQDREKLFEEIKEKSRMGNNR